ncbi:MAG: hypothetical protein ACOCP8_04270 [archaeon]
MDSIINFINDVLKILDYDNIEDIDIQKSREIINTINKFLYTNYDDIGKTNALNQEYEYFSDFHKFWEKYHDEILSPTINEQKSKELANILHELYIKYDNLFYELYETKSLNKKEICKVRFFTSNQDFSGSIDNEKMFEIYGNKPQVFNIKNINKNPENFIKEIEVSKRSQTDKRIQYAKKASEFLLNNNLKPYDLFDNFNKDIKKIRKALLNLDGAGFGKKKIDMFLRDMIVLKVWENPINFEIIDVASDINTMKVALRTGILETKIPLVSSFLDIFSHQYVLIDQKNALAWRKVWEIWKNKYPTECIEGPFLLDYLIYKIIGKNFCKEKLTLYECNKGHKFKYKNGRKQTCIVCKNENGESNHSIKKIDKKLPCSDKDGSIVISESKYVKGKKAILPGIKECPFKSVCKPNSNNFVKLRPPKSISIKQRTGWETAYTKKNEGGGGLMA